MNRILIYLLLAALPVQLYGQISAPSEVEQGQAMHFRYDDAKEGDVIRWDVLNPWPDPALIEIRTKYGVDLVVDAPCDFVGGVRVQCIVVDKVGLVRFIGNKSVTVKQSDKPIEPPNPPPIDDETGPDDGKLPEYTGENALGVGIVSYSNAPEYNAEVADIMRRAAQYLRGYPSLKVVYLENGDPNSDKLVYVWINNELKSHPEWKNWHEKVMDYQRTMGIAKGSPVALHVQYLNEAAAGIEARK